MDKKSEYLDFRSRMRNLLSPLHHTINRARSYYTIQDFTPADSFITLRASSFFFEIINILKSYFFSNLPECVVETTVFNLKPEEEQVRQFVEDLANSLVYDKQFFYAVDEAVLDSLLIGLGVINFEPQYENGDILNFTAKRIDLVNLVFDPVLPIDKQRFVIVQKVMDYNTLRQFCQEEKLNKVGCTKENNKLRVSCVYDFEDGRYVVFDDSMQEELYAYDLFLKPDQVFSCLYFAPPAPLPNQALQLKPTLNLVSIFTLLETYLQMHDGLFHRYRNLLRAVRYLGVIDNSFQEFVNAIETAEEGYLHTVNLKAYFQTLNSGQIPPVYYLPVENLVQGIVQLRESIMQLELTMRERVGIPDIQSQTKITAENYIRITPYLIDVRYANYIKKIDYFIAECYRNYVAFKLYTMKESELLAQLRIDPTTVPPEILQQLFTTARNMLKYPSRYAIVIETDSLSQQRQAKRALELQNIITQVISGISQVVNSVTANPGVALGVANTLVKLVDLYKLGKREKMNLQQALGTIVQGLSQPQPPDPEAQIEQQRLALQQQELQIKAQDVQARIQKNQLEYQAKILELQNQQATSQIQQTIQQLQLQMKEREMLIKELEAQVKAKKAENEIAKSEIELLLESQRVELEKLRTQVENINKLSDNIRLEQESAVKQELANLQQILLSKLTGVAPAINVNVPVPTRKIVNLVENPNTGLTAEVQNIFDPME